MQFELNGKSTGGCSDTFNLNGQYRNHANCFYFFLQECVSNLNTEYDLVRHLSGSYGIKWYLVKHDFAAFTAEFLLCTGYNGWSRYVFEATIERHGACPCVRLKLKQKVDTLQDIQI